MPLHYLPDFHPGIADLCKRLRYLLGGIRPRQTTHQILFLSLIQGSRLELKTCKGGISLMLRLAPELPPMLNIHDPNSISSYSKASRGLFVQLRLTSIFTGLVISPSPSLRQFSSCYAIRAGRNFNLLHYITIMFRLYFHLTSSLGDHYVCIFYSQTY